MPDRLLPGQSLTPDSSLDSPNGGFKLTLQSDGNLVLYTAEGEAQWASDTSGQQVSQAIMQDDGNFVIYDANGQPIWATDTFDNPGAWVIAQDDGNVVVYASDSQPLWASQG